MGAPNLPPVQSYHPVSFAERGVAVPFTTPLLSGARVRGTASSGIELVVPNPSGGRGVYILPWASARQLCRPTVHDVRLFERLRQLQELTPAHVRAAARAVAADGFAGGEARAAVDKAVARDDAARLRAGLLLRMALVRQVQPDAADATPASVSGAALDRHARLVLARIAPTFGRSAAQLNADLAALAGLIAGVGVPPRVDTAALPQLSVRLGELRGATRLWADSHAVEDDDIASVAAMVSGAAATVVSLAETAMREARAATGDMLGLLGAWTRAPHAVTAQLTRAAWLLDGWERIDLIWSVATWPASQRAALLEISQLIPVLPQEVADWVGVGVPLGDPEDECRVICVSETWRTGSARFGLVARNESFGVHNA